MLAAHERNRAERAAVIAPLTDLEIAHVRQIAGEESNARMFQHRIARQHPAVRKLLDQPVHLRRAEEEIDLGQRFLELALVSLDHAADGDDRRACAGRLVLTRLHQRVERLLLRRVDEAAGVHDDDFGVVQIGRELSAMIGELREIALGIDGVLVAAKRDQSDPHEPRNDSSARFLEW